MTLSHHHTITPSHYHTITLSHHHTITPSHYHTITLSHHHTITPSHYHTITLSHHHTITPSHHHTITPSHYHTITLSHHHTITPSHPHTFTSAPTLNHHLPLDLQSVPSPSKFPLPPQRSPPSPCPNWRRTSLSTSSPSLPPPISRGRPHTPTSAGPSNSHCWASRTSRTDRFDQFLMGWTGFHN